MLENDFEEDQNENIHLKKVGGVKKISYRSNVDHGGVHVCKKYQKIYTNEIRKVRHEAACEKVDCEQAVQNLASIIGLKMLNSNEVSIYDTSEENALLKDVVVGEDIIWCVLFEEGWARKRDDGKTLGTNTVSHFSKDLEVLYDGGEKDKGNKLRDAMMKASLENMYRHRYDIPTEQHIISEIGKVCRRKKRKQRPERKKIIVVNF